MAEFLPPCPISEVAEDSCNRFESSEPTLNDWLRRRARQNERSGASRTFIVRTRHGEVAGYFSLATASIFHRDVKAFLKRNMPDPIPVILLGRLAVAKAYVGQGLGRSMLQAAVRFSLEVATKIGAVALVTCPIHESARRFYLHHGFIDAKTGNSPLLVFKLHRN